MDPYDNMIVRGELSEVDDSGDQQVAKVEGRYNEQFGGEKSKMLRIQGFGFHSNPPKGSQGIVLMMGGNPDQALLLGFEHPNFKPKNTESGGTVMYDDNGNSLELKDGQATLTVEGTLTIKVSGTVVIDCPDIHLGGTGGKPVAVQGTVTSDGATLTSAFAAKVKAV